MYPDRDPQPAASTSRPVSRNPRNLEDSLPNSSHGPSRAADPPAVVPAAAIPRPATQNAGARRTDSGWNGMKRSRWESTRGGHAAAPRRESTKEAKGRQVDNAARGNQDNRHTQFERELPAHLNKGSTPAAPPPATPADLFTVYVTNAPADMTEDELRVVFNDCGTITGLSISAYGPKSAFAYVSFSTSEGAQFGLSRNGATLRENRLVISPSTGGRSAVVAKKSPPTVVKPAANKTKIRTVGGWDDTEVGRNGQMLPKQVPAANSAPTIPVPLFPPPSQSPALRSPSRPAPPTTMLPPPLPASSARGAPSAKSVRNDLARAAQAAPPPPAQPIVNPPLPAQQPPPAAAPGPARRAPLQAPVGPFARPRPPPAPTPTPTPAPAHAPAPIAVTVKAEANATQEESVAGPQESQEEEELVVRIPLPLACRGSTTDSVKRRRAFIVDALKMAYAQGKVVLSNSVVADQLVLSYVLDVDADGADATTRDMDLDSTPPAEDVKPIIRPSPLVIPRAKAAVVQETIRDPVFFPRTLQKSFVDSPETESDVQDFLHKFFDRFDSSRDSLIEFYTLDAIFSLGHVASPPARLRTAPVPFSSKYSALTDLFITPTPIINAIQRLPAGRHDLSKCIYDAWRMDPTRIFLAIHGEFEEFPSGNRMSFDRQFILVPKRSAVGCPANHLVKSDTLVYRHYLPPPALIDLAPRPTTPARSTVKRPLPVDPASDSDDDCIVVDTPPAPPVAPTPAPLTKKKKLFPAASRTPFARVVLPTQPRPRISARSRSPEGGLPEANRNAAVARRSAREATVFNELVELDSGPDDAAWREEMNERFSALQRQLAQFDNQMTAGPPVAPPKKVVAPLPEQRAPSAPLTADEEDDQLDSDQDGPAPILPSSTKAHLVKTGTSIAVSHQHGSKTNKMRYFFANDDSYLAVSSFGDVLEWDPKKQYFETRHALAGTTDRVDAIDCTRKGTLVLGYQGITAKKEDMPKYQLAMYRRGDGPEVKVRAFETAPHTAGVTAVACLSEKRLVTAGLDKAIYLWNIDSGSAALRARTTKVPCDHTAMISMLRSYDGGRKFISAGMDKKMFAYDGETLQSTWKNLHTAPISQVTPVPTAPTLFITSSTSIVNQFSLVDVRTPIGRVLQFSMETRVQKAGKRIGERKSLGRYIRGDFLPGDRNTFLHPDGMAGVLVYDIRKLDAGTVRLQNLLLGRSTVYQATPVKQGNHSRLMLLEAANLTVVEDLRKL